MLLHKYYTYGLNINSEFPLPELLPSDKGDNLYITKGLVTLPTLTPTSIFRQGKEAWFAQADNCAYLRWEGVANFKAEEGHTLIVEPLKKDLDPQFLNLYILSEALGIILYQKHFFLLHASAVKLNTGVGVFIGTPGAGKSTIAAALATQDYTVIADDLVAIEITQNQDFQVLPAFPQIKIWPSAIAGLDYKEADVTPLFKGSTKKVVRKTENFPNFPLPLKVIYLLEPSEKLNIIEMKNQEAFFALTRFFPCPSQLLTGKALQNHFQQCSQIAQKIPIYKLQIPRNFTILKELVKVLTN